MVQYTIADFVSIKNVGFDYQLPTEVLSTLRSLHRHFGSNVDVIRPLNFKKIKLDFNKPTTIIKEEVKANPITAIKLLLNKVSPKNYLECVDKLNGMIGRLQTDAEVLQVAELIFELASTNRFFTGLYADLYSHLMSSREASTSTSPNPYQTTYEQVYGTYLGMFDSMIYVDPAINYDEFCVMNTTNEKRKALSTFLGCLMKNGTTPREHIDTVLRVLLEKTETFITEPNRINEVDELVENINCLYSPAHHFTQFHPILQRLSIIKFKQFPSLSSKTLFKLQDIAKKTV
jgi:hypothetical protein